MNILGRLYSIIRELRRDVIVGDVEYYLDVLSLLISVTEYTIAFSNTSEIEP